MQKPSRKTTEVRRGAHEAAAVAAWPGWAAALCPAAAAACGCYCCACGFIIYPALRERSRECGWCARAEQPRCRCTTSLLRCWLAVDDAGAATRVPCSSYACSIDAALRRALRRASAAELIVPRARLSAQDALLAFCIAHPWRLHSLLVSLPQHDSSNALLSRRTPSPAATSSTGSSGPLPRCPACILHRSPMWWACDYV